MKSISMILSMVSEGDLEDSVLDLVLAMLLVCWRVRERDSVVNQGASSCGDNNYFIIIIIVLLHTSRELTLLMVSSGSPAMMGRGGTERPI